MQNSIKTVASIVALCVILDTVCSSAASSVQERILNFPKVRSMGMLSVREAQDQSFEEFCEARGDVTVPVGKEVLLNISREAARDL